MQLAFTTRLKLLLAVLLLALLPLGLEAYVNETSPAPTKKLLADRCSRYCERHGCEHDTPANSPMYFRLRPLYQATVRALGAGGAGLYATFNIVFYVLLLPALLVWLTYGALRNMVLIRRLKTQRRG